MSNLFKSLLNRHIGLCVFLISFMLSPWVYYPWRGLNSDGIFYIRLAYLIDTIGIHLALTKYDWPFFSAVIASFHDWTHLSYISSAYLLDAFFIGLSGVLFVKIVEKLGGTQRTQWLAALVFLSFETIINYRLDIFRDPGYWAFYLCAFYFLLQFSENLSLKNALFWFFSSIVAILFRIEGILLFFFTPLVVFFFNNFPLKKRIIAYLKLYLPLVVFSIGAMIFILFFSISGKNLFLPLWHKFISIIYTHLGTLSFVENFQHKVSVFSSNVLPKTAKQGSASIILLSGLTFYFLYKVCLSLGFFNTFIAVGSQVKKLVPFHKNQKLIFFLFFPASLLLPYNFILQTLFVNTRYLVSSSLIFLFFVPFALEYCLTHPHMQIKNLFISSDSSTPPKKPALFTLKNLFIVYLIVSAGDFGFLLIKAYCPPTNKTYTQATVWLTEHHAELPNVCSTNAWLVFAVMGEKMTDDQVTSEVYPLTDKARNCQYILIVGKTSRAAQFAYLNQQSDWAVYKTFSGSKRERTIYIFQKKTG